MEPIFCLFKAKLSVFSYFQFKLITVKELCIAQHFSIEYKKCNESS